MAFLLPLAFIAYSYYVSQKSDYGDPDFDLDDKTELDLLDSEREDPYLAQAITTISFFDGCPNEAIEFLRKRVSDILKINPWLGGRLHVKDRELKIFYDPENKDPAPNIFSVANDTTEVVLSADTHYTEYGKAIAEFLVDSANNIVGKDMPIWRVSVIPDAKEPAKRFALMVSMSRLLGDYYTYYKIFSMLGTDTGAFELNPVRKPNFLSEAQEVMGKQEASYVQKLASSPLWGLLGREKPVSHLFYISKDWVQQQELLVRLRSTNELSSWMETAKLNVSKSSSGCCLGLLPDSFIVNSCSPEEDTPAEYNFVPSSKVSYSTRDMIVSWFWRTVNTNVGIVETNMRFKLPCLEGNDAGYYGRIVPCTPRDFQTPENVRESIIRARRVGADRIVHRSTLPKLRYDTTFSFTNDLTDEPTQLRGLGEQRLHLPWYDMTFAAEIPRNVSGIIIYNSGVSDKLVAFVLAPASLHKVIETSGIVRETIAKF